MTSNTISFNNFKAFGEKMQTFSKKPITLIYGPNSVGKSSLLHAMLYLEYCQNVMHDGNIDTTNFAGDELNLGGFGNFVHKHEISNTINYEWSYNKDIFSSEYFNIELLASNSFFEQNITLETIQKKLESDYDNSGILFKHILFANLNLVNFVEDYRNKTREEVVKSEDELYKENHTKAGASYLNTSDFSDEQFAKFIETFSALEMKLKNSEDPLEKMLLAINEVEAEKIYSHLDLIRYLTTIDIIKLQLQLKIEKNKVNKYFSFSINNELIYDGMNKILNKKAMFTSKLLQIDENINMETFNESIEYFFYNRNFSSGFLSSIFNYHIFYSQENESKKPQYFGPLRFYPQRWELFEISKEQDISVNDKIDIVDINLQQVEKFRKVSKYAIFLHFKFMKYLYQEGVFNDSINNFFSNKSKRSLNDSVTTEKIWTNLIQSKGASNKINEWLSNENKLKSPYKIEIEQTKINRLDTFGYKWKYFKQQEKYINVGQTSLHKFMSKSENAVCEFVIKLFNFKHLYLNELKFIDIKQNIEVTPKDMGLGISQVLPILISLLSSKNRIMYLEQPELHLHPKIQMELADEFIRSYKENGNEFMIETHSEHLLLRIMKRMRHKAEDKPDRDKTLDLTPDDVCLLYVDNDGESTYIKELRLSKKGTLLDHWPNGFFEEGYKERFS